MLVDFLIVLISFAAGVPYMTHGHNCRNAELRAKKTNLCKDIHNDASAIALCAFGWIFSIPWMLAGAYLVTKVCGPILCDSGSSSVSGSSQNGDGDGVTVVVCC